MIRLSWLGGIIPILVLVYFCLGWTFLFTRIFLRKFGMWRWCWILEPEPVGFSVGTGPSHKSVAAILPGPHGPQDPGSGKDASGLLESLGHVCYRIRYIRYAGSCLTFCLLRFTLYLLWMNTNIHPFGLRRMISLKRIA